MPEHGELSGHILPTSAQLVGVCMMVISLVKLLHLGKMGSLLDELLAVNTIFFMLSASLSYISMRRANMVRYEKYSDYIFMLGLFLLASCAVLLALELI